MDWAYSRGGRRKEKSLNWSGTLKRRFPRPARWHYRSALTVSQPLCSVLAHTHHSASLPTSKLVFYRWYIGKRSYFLRRVQHNAIFLYGPRKPCLLLAHLLKSALLSHKYTSESLSVFKLSFAKNHESYIQGLCDAKVTMLQSNKQSHQVK